MTFCNVFAQMGCSAAATYVVQEIQLSIIVLFKTIVMNSIM